MLSQCIWASLESVKVAYPAARKNEGSPPHVVHPTFVSVFPLIRAAQAFEVAFTNSTVLALYAFDKPLKTNSQNAPSLSSLADKGVPKVSSDEVLA